MAEGLARIGGAELHDFQPRPTGSIVRDMDDKVRSGLSKFCNDTPNYAVDLGVSLAATTLVSMDATQHMTASSR